MLRNFEESFQGFIPQEQRPDDIDVTLDKIKDIDSAELNNFEQKVWDIWNKKDIDNQRKYIEIFKIFFSAFCNKSKNKDQIDYDNGQWIQGILERMGLMGVPIDTMFRETATQLTPLGTENLRGVFNKEFAACVMGAKSTIQYVDTRSRDKSDNGGDIRLLTHTILDKSFATDIIEVVDFTPDAIGTLYITQVKTKSVLPDKEIQEIYEKHKRLIEFFEKDAATWESHREEQQLEALEQIERMHGEINDIQILICDSAEQDPKKKPKKILIEVAQRLGVTQEYLQEALLESIDIVNAPQAVLALIEYIKTLPPLTLFEPVHNAIIPARCRRIISKITNGNQVISEKIIK